MNTVFYIAAVLLDRQVYGWTTYDCNNFYDGDKYDCHGSYYGD